MWVRVESCVIVRDNLIFASYTLHLLSFTLLLELIENVRQIAQVFLNLTVITLSKEEVFLAVHLLCSLSVRPEGRTLHQ